MTAFRPRPRNLPRQPRTRRPPVDVHPFVPAGAPDHDGHETCARCPLPQSRADVHRVVEVSLDVAEAEARRMGERT